MTRQRHRHNALHHNGEDGFVNSACYHHPRMPCTDIIVSDGRVSGRLEHAYRGWLQSVIGIAYLTVGATRPAKYQTPTEQGSP